MKMGKTWRIFTFLTLFLLIYGSLADPVETKAKKRSKAKKSGKC